MLAGERFEVSFDDQTSHETPGLSVGDVLERATAPPAPPSFPVLKTSTGFPKHAKRDLKRVRDSPKVLDQPCKVPSEREQISSENDVRLAAMSDDEIKNARSEILSALDPALLQRILRRADISSGSNESTFPEIDQPTSGKDQATMISREPLRGGQRVVVEDDSPIDHEEHVDLDAQINLHFPRPPQPPDLDPHSATFLDDLHAKYFADLPSDPSKLDWMRDSTEKSSYDPSHAAVNPGDIRFDFRGSLIPPSAALNIPVSVGLHHHGDAPDAAGYTIPELAHLSRSTFAPQRCIAFQTLGRILYKLGKGEFGNAGEVEAVVGAEDTLGQLARGLWHEIEAHHVIPQLVAESEGNGIDGGRHISAKAYATEAVWLWQRGGGRRWRTD